MNSKIPPTNIAVLPTGSVVLYEQDSEPLLALVTGMKKDKYQLFSERARALELSGNRLCAFSIRAQTGLNSSEQQQYLVALKAQSQKLAESVSLGELWQVVVEFPKAYDSDELAGLCFTSPSPEQKLAVKILLLTDRTHFKRDKDQFVARPASVVEELKRAQIVQLEKQRLRQGLAQYFKSPLQNAANLPEDLAPLIDLLKRYAVSADLSGSEEREAKEITELALAENNKDNYRVAPFAAYTILERIGVFGARTNPAWERSGLPGVAQYNPKDLELEELDPPQIVREDFSKLDVFTIDDISTRDMDDALSLECTDYGYRLGVHITDVASEIPVGCKLDREVAARLSSIYLPERTIHMLPEELSVERLSLLQAEKRKAVSIMVEVDRSYKILKSSIVLSWLAVKRRWTYEQVDDLLETANSEFSTFYEIASAFEAQRISLGAMHVQKTEIAASVDDEGKVSLREIEEQSPARALVAEMAVLVNRIIAEFCRDNKIPAIYRGQPESEPDEEPKPEEGPARDHFIRVRLKRSEASLEARPHAGLGLPAYLQVTSPIRRYVDLINQRQLVAYLSSQPLPYKYTDLEQLLTPVEEGLVKIQKLSKESKRFWLIRYLEQRIARISGNAGREIGGVVVRLTGKAPLVELDEVFFASFVKSNRKLAIGERVKVVIGAIDAREDYLRLEVQ